MMNQFHLSCAQNPCDGHFRVSTTAWFHGAIARPTNLAESLRFSVFFSSELESLTRAESTPSGGTLQKTIDTPRITPHFVRTQDLDSIAGGLSSCLMWLDAPCLERQRADWRSVQPGSLCLIWEHAGRALIFPPWFYVNVSRGGEP